MLYKSLYITLRHILRNPATSTFNIAGLAIGVTAFTVLLLYIQKETNYDRYNDHSGHLYRVVNNYRIGNDRNTTAWTAPALMDHVRGQVPGIETAVRLFRYRSPVVMVDRVTDKSFTESHSIWADASVFDLFTFDFISGNPGQALNRPNTMVITESAAKKYFGDTDPIGKVLSDITMETDFEITAVVRDMPDHSHFRADFICALSTLPSLWGAGILNDWGNSFLYTYVRINDQVPREAIQSGINEIASEHLPAGEEYSSHYGLQRVTDIHLHSNILNEWQPNTDIRYIYILTAVAVLILIVSGINYANLWIARSEHRTREIGIRQAIGCTRRGLRLQFTVESLTYVVLALIVGILLVGLSIPAIDEVLGEDILLSRSSQATMWLYILPGVMFFVMIVMLYPVLVISRTRPALAIKGRQAISRRGTNLWEGLITFQVLVTVCLITGTLLINKQLSFIRQQPLGYEADHLLSISQLSPTPLRERLKDALLRNNRVKSASGVSHLLGGMLYHSGYEIDNLGKNETVLWQRIHADHDFCKTYGIPIIAGRDFSKEVASDSGNFLINETAARVLGLKGEEAVGIEVRGGGVSNGKVIGVMKDFHFKTLHLAIEPLIIHIVPDRIRSLTVNIGESDPVSAIRSIEQTWNQLQPDEPFVVTALGGVNAGNYEFEEKFGKVIVFFTLLVFLLSVNGLVSLNIYIGNHRRREIGIRKVLGAGTPALVFDLVKRFALITLFGFLCSLPLSWYALSSWLEGFAYRVELTGWIFVAGGLIAFVLSMLSVAVPTWKAAGESAVNILRSAE